MKIEMLLTMSKRNQNMQSLLPGLILLGVIQLCRSRGLLGDYSVGGVAVEVVAPLAPYPLWSVAIMYDYYGPSDISSAISILDFQCSDLITRSPINSLDPPVVFQDNSMVLPLSMNLSEVQRFHQNDTVLWFPNAFDSTMARIKFCIRLDLIAGTEMTVNSITTLVVINVNASLASFSLDEHKTADASLLNTASADVTVDFPTLVYQCNGDAVETTTSPLEPGRPARLCVRLAESHSSVASLSYFEAVTYHTAVDLQPKHVVDHGSYDTELVNVDCKRQGGGKYYTAHNTMVGLYGSRDSTNLHSVCLLEFIVPAVYFVEGASLIVEGSVVIELGPGSGADQGRQLALRRRNSRTTVLNSNGGSSFAIELQLSTGSDSSAMHNANIGRQSTSRAELSKRAGWELNLFQFPMAAYILTL